MNIMAYEALYAVIDELTEEYYRIWEEIFQY